MTGQLTEAASDDNSEVASDEAVVPVSAGFDEVLQPARDKSREQINNKDKYFFSVFFIITPFRYILNNTTVL